MYSHCHLAAAYVATQAISEINGCVSGMRCHLIRTGKGLPCIAHLQSKALRQLASKRFMYKLWVVLSVHLLYTRTTLPQRRTAAMPAAGAISLCWNWHLCALTASAANCTDRAANGSPCMQCCSWLLACAVQTVPHGNTQDAAATLVCQVQAACANRATHQATATGQQEDLVIH